MSRNKRGYWDNFDNLKYELSKIYNVIGNFPTTKYLKDNNLTNLLYPIKKYGGIKNVAKLCEMLLTNKHKCYWTFEKCKEEALKYKTRYEFQKLNSSVYNIAFNKNILNDICKHIIEGRKPNNYWNYDRCLIEALKYDTRSKFQKNSSSAYTTALKKGFLNDICSHMEIQGNMFLRFVYTFEFSDKSVYVGLTQNIKQRETEHLNKEKSQIYKHIKNTNSTYILKKINQIPIEKGKAQELEDEVKLKYKNDGWNILNKGKTGKGVGSLGGNILIWTFEKCKEEALKYKIQADFINGCNGGYDSAYRNGWLKDICKHMNSPQKPNGYWNNFQKCKEEALKYKTRNDFHNKSAGAYNFARKNGWLEDICNHMNLLLKPKGYWTFEKCNEVAKLCKTNNEFKQKYKTAYQISYRNGWLKDICSHIIQTRKSYGYWKIFENLERELKIIINEINSYPTEKFLRKKGLGGMYHAINKYYGGKKNIIEKIGYKN